MSGSQIHYFGIRHHGPGSAKRLLQALNALKPELILIEGPADCNDHLPVLADPALKPPVALLSYVKDQPDLSIYFPFTCYSPELQAVRWAIKRKAQVQFIDLPVNVRLADMELASQIKAQHKIDETQSADTTKVAEAKNTQDTPLNQVTEQQELLNRDPIGALAKCAGYEDGEAWWNDFIEQSSGTSTAIFAQVASAMGALREQLDPQHPALAKDLLREAYMRQEIIKACKTCTGPVAVVCGAFHVPALTQTHTIKSDKECLKALPKKLSATKVNTTWIPWTSPRLAFQSGYGAGVKSPMWYQHLWQHKNTAKAVAPWLVKAANMLRAKGTAVSTASVIEAERLSMSLAAVRQRPSVGVEELSEAIVACLCFGETAQWQQISSEMLAGQLVGSVPKNLPLVPLLEDLAQLQKKYRLKPEALPKEHALDLRTDAGLNKSTLLHRLSILEVPWGQELGAGGSRGTFRERWNLCWEPEYSVMLIENLVYGSTIEQAAERKILEKINAEKQLPELAKMVQQCLTANLLNALNIGIKRLSKVAGQASDCMEILRSLRPLIDILRYGTARTISIGHLEILLQRLVTQAALALPYACRQLDNEEAERYRKEIQTTHTALLLNFKQDDTIACWWQALKQVAASEQSTYLITGLAARLMYSEEKLSQKALASLLSQMLSPGIEASQAAQFFDGFFSDAVEQLLYDKLLSDAINQWMMALDTQVFTEYLPLFRRVFSTLDAMERKCLLDTVLHEHETTDTELAFDIFGGQLWSAQLAKIHALAQQKQEWIA